MVRLENVTKTYRRPGGDVHALDDATFHVEPGEFVAVKGPSGSGKSTLLLTVGAMVRPTEGVVTVAQTDVYALSTRARAQFRAETLGFVFQMFHLVPYLSVVENVLLPTLARSTPDDAPETARGLLERFGLAARIGHKPAELSIGERQRVAMARALLIADEPTGNLDPANAREVMGYLAQFHRDGGTIVLVTHEEAIEQYAQRTVLIRDGRIQE